MKLKSRVERLEAHAGEGEQIVDIDLGDGRIVQVTRAELKEILRQVEGSDTGPGPAASRRRMSGLVD